MMKNNIRILVWGSLVVAPFTIYAMDGRDVQPTPALTSTAVPALAFVANQSSAAQSDIPIDSVQKEVAEYSSDDDVFMSEEHLWQIILAACTFWNASKS